MGQPQVYWLQQAGTGLHSRRPWLRPPQPVPIRYVYVNISRSACWSCCNVVVDKFKKASICHTGEQNSVMCQRVMYRKIQEGKHLSHLRRKLCYVSACYVSTNLRRQASVTLANKILLCVSVLCVSSRLCQNLSSLSLLHLTLGRGSQCSIAMFSMCTLQHAILTCGNGVLSFLSRSCRFRMCNVL